MKFRTVIFGLIAFTFIASLFAAPTHPPTQPPTVADQYGAVTLESLEATGLIRLNGTTVTNNLHLTGSLITQNAEIGSLDVIGEANLTETTLNKTGKILGSLQAVRSHFLQTITILCQKALFTSCRMEGITIQKDSSYKGKQIVELRQGTIVNGNIHFESGKGEVIIYPGSQVLGIVSGGKVIKKS